MELKTIKSEQLIEGYDKINAFITFLKKEEENAKKLGESNE